MGTFRTLTAPDVKEVLAGYGLSGYRAHRAIAAGTINTNVAVEVQGGRRYFLRVNEGKALADVEREAAVIQHLVSRGIPTPPVLRAATGQPWLLWRGLYLSLFPWVRGRVLARAELQEAHARQAGAALAALHRAGQDLADRGPGRYEPEEIANRLIAIQPHAAGDPALQAAVDELRPALLRLPAARVPQLPVGLIHGDLFIDNVLYDEGQLVAVLDFEQASWGRLAYDLAVALLAFAFGADDFCPEVTRAFLEGYCSHRPATAEERAGFLDELRFAACRFAVTRITDVYLRRHAGAPPGKDFRRYLQRLRAVERHAASGADLLRLP